jgi:hypothetical protein
MLNPRGFPKYVWFFRDWFRFRGAGGTAHVLDFYPCLFDKVSATRIDPQYFYQAVWAYKRIVENRTTFHVDVGSDVRYVGMLTAVCDVTFIDIRPPNVVLPRLKASSGSIVALPFADNSVRSLSSLHVIEHVGLGRYGDTIDPDGSAKACKELMRVLAPAGKLYMSVPIGKPRVQFNGQRVFDVSGVQNMFDGLKLFELSMVDTTGLFRENLDVASAEISEGTGSDYGLGMFVFEKSENA